MKNYDEMHLTDFMQDVMESAKETPNSDRIFQGKATIEESLQELVGVLKKSSLTTRLDSYICSRKRPITRFESAIHKQQFESLVTRKNYCDNFYMAALYLLSADMSTYRLVREYIEKSGIKFSKINEIPSGNGYTLFMVARDLLDGTAYTTVDVLADKKVIGDRIFSIIARALAICRFGIGAVGITMKKEDEEVVIFRIDKRKRG